MKLQLNSERVLARDEWIQVSLIDWIQLSFLYAGMNAALVSLIFPFSWLAASKQQAAY